jgi:nicotinate-nucleotide pyrophosphorylase
MVEEERRLGHLENQFTEISRRLEALEGSISSLVTAWNTASGIVSFVKWLAGIATAVTAIVVLIKMWGKI